MPTFAVILYVESNNVISPSFAVLAAMKYFTLLNIVLLSICLVQVSASAEILNSAADGFQIRLVGKSDLDNAQTYEVFVKDFGRWWNPDHSYFGNGEHLSVDLDQRCILELVPGEATVRHMEIVFVQKNKIIRFTGGLGPLQEMGVSGAMTFKFEPKDGKTEITLTYNVTGASFQNLDKIAGPVNSVLEEQLKRLQARCQDIARKK